MKILIFSAIALATSIACSGKLQQEATEPDDLVIVVKSFKSVEPISFHVLDMQLPVHIEHDYQASYTYPAHTGEVGTDQSVLYLVEARCNSPSGKT